MHDGLTALSTGICYQTEAILEAKLLHQSRNNFTENMSGQFLLCLQTKYICDMLLGNDEDMDRSLRLKVIEYCYLLILIYQCRGNLLSGDFAENAVICHYFPPFSLQYIIHTHSFN